MKKMCLAMFVVCWVLAVVPAVFGQQEGGTNYFEVSPTVTAVVSGQSECDCAQDCLVDYFYIPPSATSVTNWPSSGPSDTA